jgi:hypothetical protein
MMNKAQMAAQNAMIRIASMTVLPFFPAVHSGNALHE